MEILKINLWSDVRLYFCSKAIFKLTFLAVFRLTTSYDKTLFLQVTLHTKYTSCISSCSEDLPSRHQLLSVIVFSLCGWQPGEGRVEFSLSAVTSVSLASAGAGFPSEWVIVQILTENLLQTWE